MWKVSDSWGAEFPPNKQGLLVFCIVICANPILCKEDIHDFTRSEIAEFNVFGLGIFTRSKHLKRRLKFRFHASVTKFKPVYTETNMQSFFVVNYVFCTNIKSANNSSACILCEKWFPSVFCSKTNGQKIAGLSLCRAPTRCHNTTSSLFAPTQKHSQGSQSHPPHNLFNCQTQFISW